LERLLQRRSRGSGITWKWLKPWRLRKMCNDAIRTSHDEA
jgi:hypothetical protein